MKENHNHKGAVYVPFPWWINSKGRVNVVIVFIKTNIFN